MYQTLLKRKLSGEILDFAYLGDKQLLQLYVQDQCSAETIADLFGAPYYEVAARLSNTKRAMFKEN
ncbi:MAG: hypothetical protein K0R55_1831 [Sporomusa sp.]|nr:hypothetical protein [Sporomusa sp.]